MSLAWRSLVSVVLTATACGPGATAGTCTLFDPGMMFTGLGSVDGVLALPGGTSVQITIE